MGDDTFDEKLLTEKLSKLNSSQQSIESLSKWCVSHRKKAKQVVETWDTLFRSAAKEQRVSLLYLANDILQNSRRKGSEFVNEFWKVLPAALRSVYDSGDENGRKVAFRLVDIWEERKVFGSRGQNLKNEMLGNTPSGENPPLVNNGRSSNPIKIQKKDANFLRIKLAVGGLPEKILTAFQSVHDEIVNEEGAIDKCRSVVSSIREIEKNVVNVSSQGNMLGSDVLDDIQKQEDALQKCISQLENSEAVRVALVSQLREALEDQESKLEVIRSELRVARGEIEQAANMRLRLASTSTAPPPIVNKQQMVEPTLPPVLPTNNLTATPPTHPLTSFVNAMSEEESKKATAAAVAAKLTASTSSAQMFTSVLSSFVAEEAASRSSGLKRQKLDQPMVEGTSSAYFSPTQQTANTFPSVQQTGAQSMGQVQLQAPFLPPPPPPPLAPPVNSPANQFPQTSMMGMPYGYGASNLAPQTMTSTASMGFPRTVAPLQQGQQQQIQNQQPQQQHVQPQQANGGYYRPVMGFYGQTHQPSTPPIHRQ